LKNGPFVLVTRSPQAIPETPGVVTPENCSANLMSSAKAVLIDAGLDSPARLKLERACLAHGVPFFYWPAPERPGAVPEQAALTRSFLREQNEWRNVPPSPQTVEKIKLETLLDIITTANSLLMPRDVMQTVMTRIHRHIDCEGWSVLILDNNEEHTLSFAAAGGPAKEQLAGMKVAFGEGIAGWVAKYRKPVIVNNAPNDPRFLARIDQHLHFVTRNILCAPLVSRGRTIGVIEMINRVGCAGFSEDELELVQVLVNPAAVAIENAYLFQKAQMLTIQDDLTKLYNSRYLNERLDTELAAARETGAALGLIFLDLDGFKAINDSHGHLQGSQSLVEIAHIIKSVTRAGDVVGRYGGDEFVIIMPGTDIAAAIRMAEIVRDAIAAFVMGEIRITASIGIAAFPEHGDTKESLIRMADKAMYRVKEKGKNGILVAHEV
jgi:diguanylate cyclase (GGDEF)-like protein